MITEVPAVSEFLEQSVRNFTDLAVIGTSGGVDSSVVAAVCVAALGASQVHLVSMPYDDHDIATFNKRSHELAVRLRADHHVVPIGKSARALEDSMKRVFGEQELDRLTLANIRPRVRMNVLYSICGELCYKAKRRARVMGTGHMSEDLIGYDTKGGDALADIFILSEFTKSEVYQLARFYNIPASIQEAVPSAGLYPGQTDEQELGHTYDALEPATLALFHIIKRGVPDGEISPNGPEFAGLNPEHVNFVVSRYLANAHKHRAPSTVEVRRAEWFSN